MHATFWLGIEQCSNRRRNLEPEESGPRFARHTYQKTNRNQKNGVDLWRRFLERVLRLACVLLFQFFHHTMPRPVTTERAHTTGVELEAFNTLMPTVTTMATAIKHPVLDLVKPSFVIFDVRALWRSRLSVRVPGCQKLQWLLNPVWHRMLYSWTHMATVGVKGLTAQLNAVCYEFVTPRD